MIELMQQLNYILAIGAIALFFCTLLLIIDYKTKQYLTLYIERFGLHLAFLITSGSVFMTLLYSEYFGILPCGLCWMERVALYPQVALVAGAIYFKDTIMPKHGIVLSVFGLIVSLYHHYIQMGGSEFVKCPTSGADCTKRFLFEFDFVTFPLLAAVLFAFLIVLYLYILKTQAKTI
jgi:disulfide bond formation protein DsbB